MPDLTMCASTVCSVRRECMRNWDSGCLEPDRDPKIQKWVPNGVRVGYGEHAHLDDCAWYKPVYHFPNDSMEIRCLAEASVPAGGL